MEWLKRNGAMVLGVGLPIVLVVFFVLAAWIPKLFVDPPKYDVLFLTNYYDNGANTLRYQIHNKKLNFTFVGDNYGNSLPTLYHFSPTTGALRAIPINLPGSLPRIQYNYNNSGTVTPNNQITPVAVPEVNELTIDNSIVAPDGYSFQRDNYYGGGLMWGLFYSRGNSHGAALIKNGNAVKIPNMQQDYYYGAHFVGWVIP